MSDGLLTFDDGVVTLGSVKLPGILAQQSVRCGVRYDESKHDAMSGRQKLALGWEDASVSLTLDLLCDDDGDCYDKLKIINKIFKDADKGKSTPRVYSVNGRHIRARGINQVVFDALDSVESDAEDVIQVTLTFVEHLPVVIKREKQAAKKRVATAGTAKTTTPTVKATPAAAPAIVKDDNPFIAGVKAGMN